MDEFIYYFDNVAHIAWVIFGILLLLVVIKLVTKIGTLLEFQAAKSATEIEYTKKMITTTTVQSCIKATTTLIDLINTLIQIEIRAILKENITLGTPYNMTKIVEDIQMISNSVFNSLDKEYLSSINMIVSVDYIMTYITEETTAEFIKTIREVNALIREES